MAGVPTPTSVAASRIWNTGAGSTCSAALASSERCSVWLHDLSSPRFSGSNLSIRLATDFSRRSNLYCQLKDLLTSGDDTPFVDQIWGKLCVPSECNIRWCCPFMNGRCPKRSRKRTSLCQCLAAQARLVMTVGRITACLLFTTERTRLGNPT